MALFALLDKNNDGTADALAPSLKTFLTIGANYLTAKNNVQSGQVEEDFRADALAFYHHIDGLIEWTTRVDVKKASRAIVAYFTTFHKPQFSQPLVEKNLRNNVLLVNAFLISNL
jgi:hypothetical protein